MVFAVALLSQVLLASLALAVPTSKERFESRLARRRAAGRNSSPVNLITDTTVTEFTDNSTHVEYSSNWAGAVLIASSATYKSVTGTFTVPTPSDPDTSSTENAASAWVGIDGDTCQTAILQVGVDFWAQGSSVSYDAWYEYYPDYAYDFTGVTVSAGDSITLTATASSLKAGTVTVKNNSKGWTVSKSLSSTASLCEYNAEWIVEDFYSGNSLVPFADFGKVTFTGATAGTTSGSTVTAAGSTLIDIKQNNKVLTSSSVSGSTVTVEYVG